MVNEEIVGGLISALSRGEPLQKAMMSFYNAGYPKEEIEGAARALYSKEGMSFDDERQSPERPKRVIPNQGLSKNIPPKNQVFNKNKFNLIKDKPIQKVSNYGEPKTQTSNFGVKQITNKIIQEEKVPRRVQRISDYEGGPPKPVNKVIIYLLVVVLILLLGILAAVFLFKNELIGMFNNLGLG